MLPCADFSVSEWQELQVTASGCTDHASTCEAKSFETLSPPAVAQCRMCASDIAHRRPNHVK